MCVSRGCFVGDSLSWEGFLLSNVFATFFLCAVTQSGWNLIHIYV